MYLGGPVAFNPKKFPRICSEWHPLNTTQMSIFEDAVVSRDADEMLWVLPTVDLLNPHGAFVFHCSVSGEAFYQNWVCERESRGCL